MHSGFYKKGSEFRMRRIIQQVYIINEGSCFTSMKQCDIIVNNIIF